jgi:mannan endo-1,4-beta-mannosidase
VSDTLERDGLTATGSVGNAFGTKWVQAHAQACASLGKPCVFEEFGVKGQDKCTFEKQWQTLSRNTKGMAGDMYWQYGDKLSFGNTHDDGNTIYWKGRNYKCVVEDHVKAVGR